MIFNMISGGGGLNLSVTAYPTVSVLPTSAKEGSVAVITDRNITGYVFSDKDPASKSTGMVWITTSGGTVSYTVDKKGVLTLYPALCNIWDGSSWILCDAFLFKYGSWVSFATAIPMFFENGDVFESVTGGWTGDGYTGGSNITDNSKWSVGETLFVSGKDKYSNAIIGTANPVDLTNLDKIHFDVVDCTAGNSYFVVSPTKDLKQKAIEFKDPNSGNHTVTLDVTSLTGVHYIAFYVHVYDYVTTRTCTVSRVWGSIDSVGTVRTAEANIPIGSTYRYANSLQAGDWVTVSSLSFGSINYVGQGTKDYNAMMVPVPAFSYTGAFQKLKLALYLWTSDKSNHTFRWAVTTSTANAEAYKLGAGDVTDEHQLAAGSFTPPYSDAYQWHAFELSGCTVESGTPIYIYLWRDNTTYGNIHVMNSAVVTLEYTKS
jgi:hypothetical protein